MDAKGYARLVLAALVSGGLLAACGGGGHTASTGSTTTVTSPVTTTRGKSGPTTSTTIATPTTPPAGGAVPAGFDAVSFTAVSAADFWLLGYAPCKTSVCTSVVRTTDGGSSFSGIPAPVAPLTTGQSPGVNTLRFADTLDGYAFGLGQSSQAFFDTHDGGGHWAQPAALAGKTVMAFGTGGGYAFVLVGSCASGVCTSLRLERSAVGNDDWAPLSVTLPDSSGPSAALSVHGTDVWLSYSTQSDQDHQLLLHGTASGAVFSRSDSPCVPGLGADVQSVSASVLWAVCPTGMMAEAFRSADGGATWSALQAGQLVNSTLLAAVDATTAYLVPSPQGPMLVTTDAGKSWANAPGTTTSGNWSWSWVGFTDDQTGSGLQVVPDDTPPGTPPPYELWRTTDGGSSWSGPVKIAAS